MPQPQAEACPVKDNTMFEAPIGRRFTFIPCDAVQGEGKHPCDMVYRPMHHDGKSATFGRPQDYPDLLKNLGTEGT